MASQFDHYSRHRPGYDPLNCSGCALITLVDIDGKQGINYAGWPLAYIENHRRIPPKFYGALREELARTDNMPYVRNLIEKLGAAGYDLEALQLRALDAGGPQ